MRNPDNCPKKCRHLTFHYCSESGTHCNKHCVCSCSPCLEENKKPNPNLPKMGGGKILPGSTIIG